jgi:hypothetical protein
MILTPINPRALPNILDVFDVGLETHSLAQIVFRRIAATRRFCPDFAADLFAGRSKAVSLAANFGIPTLDEEPAAAFSWDGHAIRTRSEASVVFHEVAHWQVALNERRFVYDFGLGAGPETGRTDEANAAACVDLATQEEEENLASLLGIIWEVEYREPALLAFAEQNWLEQYDRASTHQHFAKSLEGLRVRRLIDGKGRPCLASTFSFSPQPLARR